MEVKIGSGADAVDTDASFLTSLLPPSSQWSCLISLKVLSSQVTFLRPSTIQTRLLSPIIRSGQPWRSAATTCRFPHLITCCTLLFEMMDAQVLRYENTKLAFHCHACLSANNSGATDQSKVKSAKRSSTFSEGGMGVEKESCNPDNINRIASQLRLKPMASLMAGSMSNCASEVVLLDEGDLEEPQEKSEDPVSPPRTAFMPISKQISHFPPTSFSSLSNAAGGTFNPSSRHSSLQPLAGGLQSPLYSNPLFKSKVPQFLGPAPHTTRIGPGFPPC